MKNVLISFDFLVMVAGIFVLGVGCTDSGAEPYIPGDEYQCYFNDMLSTSSPYTSGLPAWEGCSLLLSEAGFPNEGASDECDIHAAYTHLETNLSTSSDNFCDNLENRVMALESITPSTRTGSEYITAVYEYAFSDPQNHCAITFTVTMMFALGETPYQPIADITVGATYLITYRSSKPVEGFVRDNEGALLIFSRPDVRRCGSPSVLMSALHSSPMPAYNAVPGLEFHYTAPCDKACYTIYIPNQYYGTLLRIYPDVQVFLKGKKLKSVKGAKGCFSTGGGDLWLMRYPAFGVVTACDTRWEDAQEEPETCGWHAGIHVIRLAPDPATDSCPRLME